MDRDGKNLESRLTLKEILDKKELKIPPLLGEIDEDEIDIEDGDNMDKDEDSAVVELSAIEYSIEEGDMHAGYSAPDWAVSEYLPLSKPDEEKPHELYLDTEDREPEKERVELLEASLRDNTMGSDSLTYDEKRELLQWIAFHPLEFALYRESSAFKNSNIDYSNVLL